MDEFYGIHIPDAVDRYDYEGNNILFRISLLRSLFEMLLLYHIEVVSDFFSHVQALLNKGYMTVRWWLVHIHFRSVWKIVVTAALL